MPDAYYVVISSESGAGRFRSTPATVGPWAAHLQHGGPPNALAVACAEQALRDATGRTDLTARRAAADFLGPVPVAHLDTRVRLVRTGRTAALAEVTLAADGRDCLHSRVWFVRDDDSGAVATDPAPPPWPVPAQSAPLEIQFGFGASMDWRFVDGRMRAPGPAAAWVRPQTALFDGYELSGLARAVLVGDSANGISAELDWAQWSFVNVDLDVHLGRPVEGDWLLLQARTQVGAHGGGLARSLLYDERGEVGAGLQTLVLSRTA